MSTEPRIPDTETVRWAYQNRITDRARRVRGEEFDQWLEGQIRAAQADAWRKGEASGRSRAMRRMSDEPGVERAENPYEEDA